MKHARFTAVLAWLFLATLFSSACSGTKPNATTGTARPAPSGSTTSRDLSMSAPPDSVPSIAQREVIRRQEMVRQMDDAAIRASQRMAEDDLEGAVEGYRRAIGQ